MDQKGQLIHELTARLKALKRADAPAIETFAIEEEIAYLQRAKGPRKPEIARIRAKFHLEEAIIAIAAPILAPVVVAQPVEVVTTAPTKSISTKSQQSRERCIYERYCIECDTILEFDGLKYHCRRCERLRGSEAASER